MFLHLYYKSNAAVCWGEENTWISELFNKINVGDVRGLHYTY